MKKILVHGGTLVSITLLGTACSHSEKLREESAAHNTLIPRHGHTADPITTESVAPVRNPQPVITENREAPIETDRVTENSAAPSDANRVTTEPTAAVDDANLGASSSGRGR